MNVDVHHRAGLVGILANVSKEVGDFDAARALAERGIQLSGDVLPEEHIAGQQSLGIDVDRPYPSRPQFGGGDGSGILL